MDVKFHDGTPVHGGGGYISKENFKSYIFQIRVFTILNNGARSFFFNIFNFITN